MIQFSSVQFDTLFNTRFSEFAGLLEKRWVFNPSQTVLGDGDRAQMFLTTVPGDW